MRWYPEVDGPRNFERVLEEEMVVHIKPEIVCVVEELDGMVSSIREVVDKLVSQIPRDKIKIVGEPSRLYITIHVSTKAGQGLCQLLKCGEVLTLKQPAGQIFNAPDPRRSRKEKDESSSYYKRGRY